MTDPGDGGSPNGAAEEPSGADPSAQPPPPPAASSGGYGPPRTEPFAVASLMVSLVGPLILLPLIPGIVAIILANKANQRIAESGGTLPGAGLAKAGRVIGIVDIVVGIVIIVVAIVINAT